MTDTQKLVLGIVLGWLVITNIAAFSAMYIDKERAKKGAWRISEATLFTLAIIGGSLGANLGMQLFRHKTKHWYFVVFMPLILALHAGLLVLSGLKVFKETLI